METCQESPASLKRKASGLFDLPIHKRKLSDEISQDNDVHSDVEDDHNSSDEEASAVGDQTPLTPQSSKDWPSLRKSIGCTFPGCTKTYNRQAKLREHLRYHTGERPFLCPNENCDKAFPRKAHLDRHVKSAHTDVRDYLCPYDGCGKAFSTGTRLRRHEASHVARLQFQCEECGQEFRKHATLQKHVTTEHQGMKAFICREALPNGSICNAGFDRPTGLSNHQAQVHSKPKYTCTLCDSAKNEQLDTSGVKQTAFATYSDFQEHNRLVHPPTCDSCRRICASAKELKQHLEIEHGITAIQGDGSNQRASHVCPEPGCGRAFSKNGNLQVHIRNVHQQKRPFVCGVTSIGSLNNIHGWDGTGACSRDFKAKSHLEEHIRTIHLGLEHRHKSRRDAKKRRALEKETVENTPQPSTISMLTGFDYAAEKSRSLKCLVTGCSFAFSREYDLDVHLRARHGLDENEVQIIRLSQPVQLFGNSTQSTREQDPNQKFDEIMNNDQNDNMIDATHLTGLEDLAPSGEEFWVTSSSYANEHPPGPSAHDDWELEEAEMRELVGEGHGWEDDIIVDASLRR